MNGKEQGLQFLRMDPIMNMEQNTIIAVLRIEHSRTIHFHIAWNLCSDFTFKIKFNFKLKIN